MSDGAGRIETKEEISKITSLELRLWLIQELSATDNSAGWFVDACIKELRKRGVFK